MVCAHHQGLCAREFPVGTSHPLYCKIDSAAEQRTDFRHTNAPKVISGLAPGDPHSELLVGIADNNILNAKGTAVIAGVLGAREAAADMGRPGLGDRLAHQFMGFILAQASFQRRDYGGNSPRPDFECVDCADLAYRAPSRRFTGPV